MSALEVFHDEIAHLVLSKQRTNEQVYDYLVRKYGVHKGLTLRNVRRFCQMNGYRRDHPHRRTKFAIADNLRKVRNKVLGIPDDDTEIAHDEFEQIVTEFPNNPVESKVQDSESNQQQQGEDHEYHISDSGSTHQGNRLQKETKIIPVTIPVAAAGITTSTTCEEPSNNHNLLDMSRAQTTTAREPAGDHGVTNQEEVSAGDGAASSSTAHGNVDAASVSFILTTRSIRL